MNDLFQSSWECRHGAATGLREVVKLHGQTAGMSVDTPADQVTFTGVLTMQLHGITYNYKYTARAIFCLSVCLLFLG